MAGRVFHEDNLVVEEVSLEKGGDEIVPTGLEPQASLDGNENTDRRVAQGRRVGLVVVDAFLLAGPV